jgi:predicted metalloprotease with PDZ domain
VIGTGRLEEKWFNEGVTEYYGYRGCGPVRTVDSLRGALDYYQRALEVGQDMALDQAGQLFGTERYFFYYAKGALVALMLDRELVQNYDLSLDNVLRATYDEYGIYGGVVTNADILRILNQVTGEDFTDFFNKYVYGTVELPLTEQDLAYLYH